MMLVSGLFPPSLSAHICSPSLVTSHHIGWDDNENRDQTEGTVGGGMPKQILDKD